MTLKPQAAHPAAMFVLLAVLLAVVGCAALVLGDLSSLSFGDGWRVLTGGQATSTPPAIAHTIVFETRLPRITLLAIVGMALAIAGATLQASLQNSLADPSLLGLSAGAALGAVSATVGQWQFQFARPIAAFAGALLALSLVYLIAHAAGRPTTGMLLLTGVAVGSLASSVVSLLIVAEGQYRVAEVMMWLLGSATENIDWPLIRLSLPPILLGAFGLFACGRIIDALALGEEHALSVGVDLLRGRALLFVLVALCAGGAVGAVGPIGFVGLMVPHLLRPFTGPAARVLLPAAALGGASFLVLADLVARLFVRWVDVPIGVVTALAGVPFFLLLLHRARAR